MTEYLITFENGAYPLTYAATHIYNAFECIMEAARQSIPDSTGNAIYKNRALVHMDPDDLMDTLSAMRTGKTTFHKQAGFQIERREIPDPSTYIPVPPSAPVPDWLEDEQKKWRRFELTVTSKEQVDELNTVLANSNFTRRDLALIVTCLRLRPEFSLADFTAKEDRGEPFATDDP